MASKSKLSQKEANSSILAEEASRTSECTRARRLRKYFNPLICSLGTIGSENLFTG